MSFTSWAPDIARGLPTETGAYVGIQFMEYGHLPGSGAASLGPYNITGAALSVAAGRLSYTFGFKGPAVSVDTACSSALVAAHMGAQQLAVQPQSAALAAAVNFCLSETTAAMIQAANMTTMDGRCKTLDAAADGYVRYGCHDGCVEQHISHNHSDLHATH